MAARDGSPLAALTSIAACLLALGLLSPHRASAAGEPGFGCKHSHRRNAQVNPNPTGRPPLVIGDSTVLLPIPDLIAAGYSVNARGCRGFREAVSVAEKIRRKHRLPHLVLMNDYGNGGVHLDEIQEALAAIGKSRVLGLITEYDANTGRPPAPDTDVFFKARSRYPHRIAVLDWIKYSRAHHKAEPKRGAWFLPDLFHPNFAGSAAYAQFLSQALPLAEDGRFPPLP
ncbi:MAG: hypothetical protein ACJ75Z_01730 [Solirubrobacterales bacterium]